MLRVVSGSVAGTALLLSLLLSVSPAHSASRTPAEATQHALDELANCQEQSRLGLRTDGSWVCPTATPVPTGTPVPTASPSPTPVPPSDAPTDVPTATPTPGPCWLTDEVWGDPDNGNIVFVPMMSPDDGSPLLNDDGTQQYGPVQIPCDSTPTPTPAPTDVPTDVPTATPRPPMAQVAAAPPAARSAPAPAAPAQERIVVQTVVVEVTPVPTQTPSATPTGTPRPSSSPAVHASVSPSVSPAVSTVPSPTATPHVEAASLVPGWIQGPLGIVAIVGIVLGGVACTVGGLLIQGRI